MGRKRHFYDAKGRSTGFSSDEGPGTRNAKALMIALPLLALMSMCGVEIKPGSTSSDNKSAQLDATASEDSDGRTEDGSIAYVVTGRANLRYDTKATDTPVVGQLVPGEQITGEPRKGADSRTWVMITEGPQSGSFVWAGNLRRANDRPQATRKQLVNKPDAVNPDARNDIDCSVIAFYLNSEAKRLGASEDQQRALAALKSWYVMRVQKLAAQQGSETVEERATLLLAALQHDPASMKEAADQCIKRAVREGLN